MVNYNWNPPISTTAARARADAVVGRTLGILLTDKSKDFLAAAQADYHSQTKTYVRGLWNKLVGAPASIEL